MRIHCLVFLASSALSARAAGVLEPANRNGTALYSPAAVRSVTDNDNGVSATTSSKKDDLSNEDERGFSSMVNAMSAKIGKMVEESETVVKGEKHLALKTLLKGVSDDQFLAHVRYALATPEGEHLYQRYRRSGESMLDALTQHYDADRMVSVLSKAVEADFAKPELIAKYVPTLDKLAMDQLNSWKDKGKTLDDVFRELKLGANERVNFLYEDLVSRRMKVLAGYSKLINRGNSDIAYMKAVIEGFGGREKFSSLLRKAKQRSFHQDELIKLEDLYLKTCLVDNVKPMAVFEGLVLGVLTKHGFDGYDFRNMERYVENYNTNNPSEQQTTVLEVLTEMLGGEAKLIEVLAIKIKSTHATNNRSLYEHKLFEQWDLATILPEKGFLQHLQGQGLDDAIRTAVERRYTRWWNKRHAIEANPLR